MLPSFNRLSINECPVVDSRPSLIDDMQTIEARAKNTLIFYAAIGGKRSDRDRELSIEEHNLEKYISDFKTGRFGRAGSGLTIDHLFTTPETQTAEFEAYKGAAGILDFLCKLIATSKDYSDTTGVSHKNIQLVVKLMLKQIQEAQQKATSSRWSTFRDTLGNAAMMRENGSTEGDKQRCNACDEMCTKRYLFEFLSTGTTSMQPFVPQTWDRKAIAETPKSLKSAAAPLIRDMIKLKQDGGSLSAFMICNECKIRCNHWWNAQTMLIEVLFAQLQISQTESVMDNKEFVTRARALLWTIGRVAFCNSPSQINPIKIKLFFSWPNAIVTNLQGGVEDYEEGVEDETEDEDEGVENEAVETEDEDDYELESEGEGEDNEEDPWEGDDFRAPKRNYTPRKKRGFKGIEQTPNYPRYGYPRQNMKDDTIYSINGLFTAMSLDVGARGLFTGNEIKAGDFIGFYGDMFTTKDLADKVMKKADGQPCPLFYYTADFDVPKVEKKLTAIPMRHIGAGEGTIMGYANELPVFTNDTEWEMMTAVNIPTNNMFLRVVRLGVRMGTCEEEMCPVYALGMFALRNIKEDEELFWFYGPMYDRTWASTKGNSKGNDLRNQYAQNLLDDTASQFFKSRMRSVQNWRFPVFTHKTIVRTPEGLKARLEDDYEVRKKDQPTRSMTTEDLCKSTNL